MKFDFLKNRKFLICVWIIILIWWIGFIFSNSIATAEESSSTSQGVVEAVEEVVQKVVPEFEISNHFVRKLAHFIEFFILGCIFNISYYIFNREFKFHSVLSLFVGLVISVIDETLQLYSDGRAGMIIDVWLDFSAVICALLLFFVIVVFLKRSNRRKSL